MGTARKLPIILGLAMTVFMLGANYTESSAKALVFMLIAFLGNGFASITRSLVSALGPGRLLGPTGGIFNFTGNLSSIATPIVIGFLVSDTDFGPIVYMAAVTIVGALSYVFLVGRVERVEE